MILAYYCFKMFINVQYKIDNTFNYFQGCFNLRAKI